MKDGKGREGDTHPGRVHKTKVIGEYKGGRRPERGSCTTNSSISTTPRGAGTGVGDTVRKEGPGGGGPWTKGGGRKEGTTGGGASEGSAEVDSNHQTLKNDGGGY